MGVTGLLELLQKGYRSEDVILTIWCQNSIVVSVEKKRKEEKKEDIEKNNRNIVKYEFGMW